MQDLLLVVNADSGRGSVK